MGRQPSFARADHRNSRASDVESRSDLPSGICTAGYRGDSDRTNGTRAEPLRTCPGNLPLEGTSAASRETGTELSAGSPGNVAGRLPRVTDLEIVPPARVRSRLWPKRI